VQHHRRPAAVLLSLLLALVAAALATAARASAHATVVGSDPADRARLRSAPADVTVRFDEPVTPVYLHVTGGTGTRVDQGAVFHPKADGRRIEVRLRPGLGDGSYVASFRVVSADSHPVTGIVRFVVGAGPLAVAAAGVPAATDAAASAAMDAARWLSYAGFALLGGVWLLLAGWPEGRRQPRARRIVLAGWAATAAGGVAELLLQGPYAAGESLGGLGDGSLLTGTLHTGYGVWHCVRLGLLVLLGAVPAAARVRAARPLTAALLGGVALTFAMAGHPATTPPAALSVVADVAHIGAMAVWVGGLVMALLALLPGGTDAEIARAVPLLSRVAFGAVAALAVTGTYAAWRNIGAWRAVVGTEYGLLVLTKVVLFAALLALGNTARRIVGRRLLGAPPARERVRRGLVVEVGLAGLVLAVTAVLVAQPRGPEALAAQDRRPVSAAAPLGDGRTVTVTVDPGVHGPVSAQIVLTGAPRPHGISATATQPHRGIGPLPVPLRAEGAEVWDATNLDLPVSGTWVFEIVVTDSPFSAVSVDVRVGLH
jgi:copper transport protein